MLTLQSTKTGLKAFTDIFASPRRETHIVDNIAETVVTVETAQTLKKLHKIFLWPTNLLFDSFYMHIH